MFCEMCKVYISSNKQLKLEHIYHHKASIISFSKLRRIIIKFYDLQSAILFPMTHAIVHILFQEFSASVNQPMNILLSFLLESSELVRKVNSPISPWASRSHSG